MPLRLIFMGTPDFAVPTLLALTAAGHDIVAVYTRAPKPAGRGMDMQVTPVEREARIVAAAAGGVVVVVLLLLICCCSCCCCCCCCCCLLFAAAGGGAR